MKVFEEKPGITKIVLATNIAESSITIPNVSVVIDEGREITNTFNPIKQIYDLISTPITQASAN